MADQKISQLTNYTSPLDADVVPIVDTANSITKKLSWANIKTTLKSYFDGLYAGIGITQYTDEMAQDAVGGILTDTATIDMTYNDAGNGITADVKSASITEAMQVLADNTTQDVSTSKHGYAPKGDGSTTKFLNANGAYSTPTASVTPTMMKSTIFETAGRFSTSNTSAGTTTYDNLGMIINTSATISSATRTTWPMGNSTASEVGSPVFSCSLYFLSTGTDFQFFCGLGTPTTNGAGITFTVKHIGFKITRASTGTISVFATQADGSTENASSALTTITAGSTDSLELIFKVNSTASVDYYWRKNGGALSSATNLTTNMPTALSDFAQFCATNIGVATQTQIEINSASYER